ncbi:hypothetical protein RCO48_11055 [Peribacillus frigoritolerans]|nr:hypothetical protein [Peribacillus frigoritolerans]
MNVVTLNCRILIFPSGTVLIHGKGKKDRYVPVGRYAQEAIDLYIRTARMELTSSDGKAHVYLFVNFRGDPLTPREFAIY